MTPHERPGAVAAACSAAVEAFAGLRRSPAFALAAVTLLAIASAVLLALAGLGRSVLASPWPYRGAERLMVFRASFPALAAPEWPTLSRREIESLRALPAFDGWIVGQARGVTVHGAEGPAARLRGARLAAGSFEVLGVPPLLGRALVAADERPGAPPVAVLSYGAWRGRFGGEPSVVGRVVELDGRPTTVVGVMPEAFVWWDREVWLPLPAEVTADPERRDLYAQARRAPDVDVAAAQAQLDAWAAALAAERGGERPEYRGFRLHALPLRDEVVRNARPALLALLAVGAGLLLLAAANLANLALRRSLARRRDFAVRSALGARRVDLVRGVLAEMALVAFAGTALGAALAGPLLRALAARLPYGYVPAEARLDLDLATLAAGSAAVLGAALAAGALAALPLVWSERGDALRSRAVGPGVVVRRLRAGLVVFQAAVAFTALVAATQLERDLVEILSRPAGFATAQVATARLDLALRRTRAGDAEGDGAYVARLLDALRASPDVAAAGVGTALPLGGIESRAFAAAAALPEAALPEADYVAISPGYLAAIGAHVVAGRDFDERDGRSGAAVALVSRAFAARFFPGRSPLGERLRLESDAAGTWRSVVGVVEDLRQHGLLAPVRQQLFVPLAQSGAGTLSSAAAPASLVVAVRARSDVAAAARALAVLAPAVDPRVPVFAVESWDAAVDRDLGARRFAAWVLRRMAAAALGLAGLGLYAVLALAATERRRELGVRLAVGARPLGLAARFEGRAAAAVALGALLGVPFAALLLRALGPEVAGTAGPTPAALAGAAGALLAMGLLAALPAAWRVGRLDAGEVLRGA